MNDKILTLIGIGICAVLLFGVFMQLDRAQTIVGGNGNNERVHTVSVSGVAESKVAPDQAVLRLGVMTKSALAKTAEEENSRIMNLVIKALKEEGIAEKDIVMEYYSLYPEYEYEPQTGRSEQRGFQAQHTIRVTVRDVAKAGEVLDAAVSAGVTNVDSVMFSLSEDKEKELREDLTTEAAGKARERAEALVGALGSTVGRVVSVSEVSYAPPIYYARDVMMAKAEGAPNEIPSFNPEDVTVQMQINVEFEIE